MAIKQFLFQSPDGYADTAGLDAETQLAFLKLTGISGDPNGIVALDVDGKRIVGVADPVLSSDAANKNYVDSVQSGLTVKEPARVMAVGNIDVSAPGATIDGVTMVAGDRVLLTEQTNAAQNGVYVYVSDVAPMTRATDANSGLTLKSGAYVFVQEGTVNADSAYVLTTDVNPIVVGTTNLSWVQFSGLGQVTAGLGLLKSGNTVYVGKGDGIAVSEDSISVDLDSFPALALNGTTPDKKLAWLPNTSKGLSKDLDGAFIKLDDGANNPALYFLGSGALEVKFDPNGGLLKDANGLKVKLASVNQLSVDGSGIWVEGVPALFKIDGVQVGTGVTAANLTSLTNGSEVPSSLHTHPAPTEVPYVKETWLAGETINAGTGVYVSANNAVKMGGYDTDARSRIIGVAEAEIANAASGKIVVTGEVTGVLVGATPGNRYFVGEFGEPVLITALPARARTVQLGIAKNATDLTVRVFDFGKKA